MGAKSYEKVDIVPGTTIGTGFIRDLPVPIEPMEKLFREAGLPYSVFQHLRSRKIPVDFIYELFKQSGLVHVYFLLQYGEVIDYIAHTDREPILNSVFCDRVDSLFSTSEEANIVEIACSDLETTSHILVKRDEPITVHNTSVDVGFIIFNDELYGASARMVLFMDDIPHYLPSSVYNSSTQRYKKSTDNSIDALEVMTLSIIDMLRNEQELIGRLGSTIYTYRSNLHMNVTYEEYHTSVVILQKISTFIDNPELLEPLLTLDDEFDSHYPGLSGKQVYIWRCTAEQSFPLVELLATIYEVLGHIAIPIEETKDLREKLGEYVSTPLIASKIAREVART